MHKLPRFLCPALSRSLRTKRPTRSPLLQNIEKLESYLKTLEKTVKKQAVRAQKKTEAKQVDDETASAMYASLQAAEQQALAPGTQASLPVALRESMQIAASADPQTIDWGQAVTRLVATEEAAKLTTLELNQILLSMPARARLSAGQRLLTHTTCKRDTLSFDLLMDAHASLSQVQQALSTFDDLRQAGLTPTQYSYAHLMKAFAKTSDVHRAAALYKHMQDSGIEPNLVTSTTLINCCIRAGNTDRAFSIFDALKYRATSSAPDIHTYSLMISACSRDRLQSAERASELFEELAERGLQPTRATFNALIHVYATRRDYFAQAWQMAERMKANGIDLDKTTWHALLAACARNRDIGRARTLVRELEAIGRQNDSWAPDERTYQLLFRAYAQAAVKKSRVAADARLITSGEDQLDFQDAEMHWIEEMPFTSNDVLEESQRLMAYIQRLHPEYLSTQLIDTYMTIAIPFQADRRFKQDWATLYKGLQRSKYSFQIALQAAYAFRNSELLNSTWSEYKVWQGGTNDLHDREVVRLFVEALARCDRLQEATDVLAEARTVHRFAKNELRCFQTKGVQLEHEEAVTLFNSMFPATGRQDGRYQ